MVYKFLLVALLLSINFVAAAAPKAVVLEYRYWTSDPEGIVSTQTLINQFERSHPGIIIEGEPVTSGNSDYLQKILLEQVSGLCPDIIFTGDYFPEFIRHGIYLNLNPLVKADKTMSLSEYFPKLIQIFSRDGNLYALPHDVAPTGIIYYNKTLFNEAKIPYPDGSWSWSYSPRPELGDKDFLTVAERLTRRSKSSSQPLVYGYASDVNGWTMDNFVYSSGADYVDNLEHPTKVLYGDPRVVKAAQLTADLMYKYDVSPSAADLLSAGVGNIDLFAEGKAAMYMSGIWDVSHLRQNIKTFDWDIAPFPAGPTGIHAVGTGLSGVGISASTKHPKEAYEFLKFICGPAGLTAAALTGSTQPSIVSLANSKIWLDGRVPVHREVTNQETEYIHYSCYDPDWTQVRALIDPKLELVWNGTLTAQQAINLCLWPAQQKLNELNHPKHYPRLNWGLGVFAICLMALALALWVVQGAREDLKNGHKVGPSGESRAGYFFIAPWLFGVIVFLTVPMLMSLLLAFCSWDLHAPATFVGLDNLREMAGDGLFWKSLMVTGTYTLFSVPLGVAGSLTLALLLHAKIRGQGVFRTLYYIPAIASTVAASLIWMRMFNPESGLMNYCIDFLHLNPIFRLLGLTDPVKGYVNWLGSEKTALPSLIIMSLWGIGGGMVIFLAGLQGIPQSYYEAAEIDGANVWLKFTNVTLPMLSPTIFFSLIIGVISSFQVFTQGLVMTNGGGPNNATLFYVLYLYQNAFTFLKIGYASAMAWVLFLIILAFTMIQMRMSKWVHY